MKLTKDILPLHFTLASPKNSHYKVITNTFDFIDNNSDSLVVTIGDSWTWGSDISIDDNEDIRLSCVYGRLISDKLGSDWFNLSQPGAGNFWIADRAEELSKIIPQLEYKKIIVVCTLTEIGRSFDSHHDRYIDYHSWFKNNDYNNFLEFLNKECINRIIKAIDEKTQLRIGTNFVDPIGFDDTEIYLKKSWLDCITPTTDVCYVATHGIDHLDNAREFFQSQTDFLTWSSNLITLANKRLTVLSDQRYFRSAHPLKDGHEIWSNYILKSL
jgi:hypothetical protein